MSFVIPTDSSEQESEQESEVEQEAEIDSDDVDAYEPSEHDAAQVQHTLAPNPQELEDDLSHSDHEEEEADRDVPAKDPRTVAPIFHPPGYKSYLGAQHQQPFFSQSASIDEDLDEHEQDGELVDENIFSHLEADVEQDVVYPKVSIVDLESKSFVRSKRFELEPVSNPTVFNISALAGQIVVPLTASWYLADCLHECEKRAFRDYVDAYHLQKSEEIYMRIRNHIVLLYRTYLTVTRCVEIIDVGLQEILRIHSFLEYYGLINFQARNVPRTKQTFALKPPFKPSKKEFFSHQELDPKLINSKCMDPMKRICSKCDAVCGEYWYRTLAPKNIILCGECFGNGRFGIEVLPDSFVRVHRMTKDLPHNPYEVITVEDTKMEDIKPESIIDDIKMEDAELLKVDSVKDQEDTWTQHETLTFLTLLQTHQTHSPIHSTTLKKPQHEILRKFIQLTQTRPIESEDTLRSLFIGCGNPLMGFLSTVSASLGPAFASNAARHALNLICELNEGVTHDEEGSDAHEKEFDIDDLDDDRETIVCGQVEALESAIQCVSNDVDEEEKKLMGELEGVIRELIERELSIIEMKLEVVSGDINRVQ